MNTFSIEVARKWAQEGFKDKTYVDLAKLRRITMHPDFVAILKGNGIQEIIPIAQIIVFSQLVSHGLNEEELEKIYREHCVRNAIEEGERWKLTSDESLQALSQYIDRVSRSISH